MPTVHGGDGMGGWHFEMFIVCGIWLDLGPDMPSLTRAGDLVIEDDRKALFNATA